MGRAQGLGRVEAKIVDENDIRARSRDLAHIGAELALAEHMALGADDLDTQFLGKMLLKLLQRPSEGIVRGQHIPALGVGVLLRDILHRRLHPCVVGRRPLEVVFVARQGPTAEAMHALFAQGQFRDGGRNVVGPRAGDRHDVLALDGLGHATGRRAGIARAVARDIVDLQVGGALVEIFDGHFLAALDALSIGRIRAGQRHDAQDRNLACRRTSRRAKQ